MIGRKPHPSASGYQKARERTKEFADELLLEAGRLAQRFGAEEASAKHVDEAAERLYRRSTTRRQQVVGSLGGVLAGGGGSAMVSLLLQEDVHGVAVGGSAAVMSVGLVCAVYGIFDR